MKKVGRLALRDEGDWWVAYYAMPDTMDDAIEIARVRMGPVRASDVHKRAFIGTVPGDHRGSSRTRNRRPLHMF